MALVAALVAVVAAAGWTVTAGFRTRRRLLRLTTATPPVGLTRPRSWMRLGAELLQADRRAVGVLLAVMLLDTAASLAAPWPLQFVVDHALGHRPLPGPLAGLSDWPPWVTAASAGGVGIVVLALGTTLGYLTTVLGAAEDERVAHRFRHAVLSTVLRAPPRRLEPMPLGEMVNRLGADTARVADTIGAVVTTAVPDIALLAGMGTLTVLIDWHLSLVAAGLVPVYVLVARRRNRTLRVAQQTARTRAGLLSTLTADLLGRLPAVHVFDQADREAAVYADASAATADAAIAAVDASARFSPVTDLLPGLALAGALTVGTVEITTGRLTVGALLVFLAYLGSLTGPIRSLTRLSSVVARGSVSRDRIADLLEQTRPPMPTPAGSAAGRPRPDARTGTRARADAGLHRRPRDGGVELVDVSYRTPRGDLLFDRLTTAVDAGQFVCVTGPSGIGKSTLLALLAGLVEPESGVVRIGGRDISTMTNTHLRSLVTFVPQDPWLHRATIGENIAYGRPDAPLTTVRAAAVAAGVHSFVRQLPQRYDTSVGAGGHELSGGQQRRIAIARALVHDTPVVLLDEPTSGLDDETAEQVAANLRSTLADRTVLIVSHHGHLARQADVVFSLNAGSTGTTVDLTRL